MPTVDRKLKVFLCHASQDKPIVRELCQRLVLEGWIDPWLDEDKLALGQHWAAIIEETIEAADVVIIFLSRQSVQKEGFVQRELNHAWEFSLEKPRDVIFLIPFRLDDCEPPRYLRARQWGDYFGEKKERTYAGLLQSLQQRHEQKLRLEAEERAIEEAQAKARAALEAQKRLETEELARKAAQEKARAEAEEKLRREAEEHAWQELKEKIEREAREKVRLEMEARLRLEAETRVRAEYAAQEKLREAVGEKHLPVVTTEPLIPTHKEKPEPTYFEKVWQAAMDRAKAKKPVISVPPDRSTLNGMEFCRVPAGKFWMGSAADDKNAYDSEKPQNQAKISYDYWLARFPVTNAQYAEYIRAAGKDHPVGDWQKKKDHPVTRVGWQEAMAYCQWLNELVKGKLPQNYILRLPGEAEWEKAARGLAGRAYPWGNAFDKDKCNTAEGGKRNTTPVDLYSPQGDSPYGCADMSGNVWEWTHSLWKAYPYEAKDGREDEKSSGARVLRGGSCLGGAWYARCVCRLDLAIHGINGHVGFRMALAPPFS